ncbi:MAG: protease inhibitor I42 family protein [Alphaproteobacteria bacterium]|nr:protease inhibitor I42 family protein [Alphaproteobacteria bacterium]
MFKLSLLTFISLLTANSCCYALDITQNDSGKQIEVTKGDIVTIKLAENPTTGYSWQFEVTPENNIEVISAKYIAPRTTLIGAGGTKEYKFEVKNTGRTTINGYYVRPWEELDKNTATQVHYTINAQ